MENSKENFSNEATTAPATATTTTANASKQPEVSLPGSEPAASDDLTILQVINKIASATPTDNPLTNHTTDAKDIEVPQRPPTFAETKAQSSDSSSEKNTDTSLESIRTEIETPCRVLDIESHLIENLDSSSDELSSVGINELLPQSDELTAGTSKAETDIDLHTVIEVEPVGVKTKQPVEICIATAQQPDVASLTDIQQPAQDPVDVSVSVEHVEQIIETEPFTVDATFNDNTASQETTPSEEVIVIEAIPQENEVTKSGSAEEADKTVLDGTETRHQSTTDSVREAIKATAEWLVKEIEEAACARIDELAKEALQDTEETESKLDTEQKTEQETIVEAAVRETENISTATIPTTPTTPITELTGILKTPKSDANADIHTSAVAATSANTSELKVVQIPTPNSPSEEEERKRFLDSLPQIKSETDATKLQADCKREYYQSLKKYLIDSSLEKPPVPLQTYRWEDLKRAKERGGYPWTHLYKRPLGPDEEPEIILLLRKSQELRFASESPKSLKRVRYDEQVLVKETDRYIQELSDTDEEHAEESTDISSTDKTEHTEDSRTDDESRSVHSESISCVSDSCLTAKPPKKRNHLARIKGIIQRKRSGRNPGDTQSLPGTSVNTSLLDIEAETEVSTLPDDNSVPKTPEQKQTRYQIIMKKLKSMAERQKKRLNIKRISLKKDEKINLGEETKILKLKNSPKSERSEIPHFVEKQDSDDVLEIVELDESPSRKRNESRSAEEHDKENIEAATSSIIAPDEIIELETKTFAVTEPTSAMGTEEQEEPKRTQRLRREHVYEEIEQNDQTPSVTLPALIEPSSVEALKKSLVRQDNCAMLDIEAANKVIPLDRMGSSEEEQIVVENQKSAGNLLAPISSIDSASSDEERNRVPLSPVAEESDAASQDGLQANETSPLVENATEQLDLKPTIKKEPSPAPSDKKVTFSHVEDEAEPHREDIELPESVREAVTANNKWKNMRDHDYEPIGEPAANQSTTQTDNAGLPIPQADVARSKELETLSAEIQEAAELQKELEDRYFTSNIANQPEVETPGEGPLSDEDANEQIPKAEKKGFMATAQDHTRRMQSGIKNQATKIKTRLRPIAKKPVSGSPKTKKKDRFKAPQFSKLKMPEIKKPDMSKIKEFKRPEFTKFNKPDMSKFKLPERFTTLKLKRSHSFKHEDEHENELSTQSPDSQPAKDNQPQKKTFEFNFGTYPRAFRKKKKPVEPVESSFGTEGASVNPSSTTQPSFESSSSPQGDRGPGPVRSRWADKFSDVSYNDSEGSRYRRYGSEQESFDKESSLERRMKDDLEESASETHEMGILGGVADTKQFAEFDEENRAIHEISNLRSGEFKRRPIVHQDSDLRSEDSKEAVGWTDKEVQRNKLLRKAEMEAEAIFLKYHGEESIAQETQSTASSTGRKVVMEEIDDDEFFLRKRGISEDNIELRQYISSAIRGGYDMPINALEHVGQSSEPPMEFGDYDVPPPKPRRLHKGYRPQDESQEFDMQRSDYGDDFSVSQNGSDFFVTPKKPLRKDRSRSKYSMDSENPALTDERISHEQYFDNDEDYLRPPQYNANDLGMNDLSFTRKDIDNEVTDRSYPQPPRRQKRRTREGSLEKDSLINGFGGKSVSSSFLQEPKDVIVYRTEHEYHIPIATPDHYTDDASTSTHKSRSASRYDEDEHSAHALQSFDMDANVKTDYNGNTQADRDKFIIDMMENDGYAIVRKEHMPKPTPPARRKRFARSPGERFATLPNMRTKRGTPPPERPPPPRAYIPSVEQPMPPMRKSSHSLDTPHTYDDDYEEPEAFERPESPRNLQSGEVINKMKYRPLPAPPRPPREKRQRGESKSSMQTNDEESAFEYADSEDTEHLEHTNETEIDERLEEVEAATQTDPLPDNYEVAAFEIDDSMRVIEPRRRAKTIEELLEEEAEESELQQMQENMEDEQLTRGLQRFRDANQRSLSERSRASSQADRSKSLSRPQTPSAVVIESRVSTPSPYKRDETVLAASLLVKPLDDLDLEEAELRREGLLSDSSQKSVSDIERDEKSFETQTRNLQVDELSNAPSSTELTVADYEQRLLSDEERETQSEQEKIEPTLSDFEAELEERYSKGYSLDAELTESSSKPYSDEEIEHKQAKLSTPTHYYEDKNERAPQQIAGDIKSPTEEMIKDHQAEERDSEQPAKSVESKKETSENTDYKSYTTTKEETEQKMKEPTPPAEYPQPPPRRKSATNIETTPTLTIAEQTTTTITTPAVVSPAVVQLPSTVGDLAVERLHVHALQAGQIMVSQMHGAQISSDQLECNSANLVVNNIQLPPGFIENIVERVRSTDKPTTLLTVETQTSLTASSEELLNEQEGSPIPPKKPARQKQTEQTADTCNADNEQQQQQKHHKNPDEQTQTDPIDPMLTTLSPLLPTAAEYMQTLAPLAFYNMHRAAADNAERSTGIERTESTHRRRRPYRRHSSSSGNDETTEGLAEADKQHTQRRRTRSSTQPPVETPTIAQAASQFLSACSLSLVNIINQLTDYVRADNNKAPARTRQVPTLVALFIVITFVLLLFLLSGKNVHTHHWDFFNPPGNEGRK